MVVTKRSDIIIQRLFGEIMKGEKGREGRLPSANQLSEEYGISIVTIRESLKILEAMGILTIEHGKGIFIDSPVQIMGDVLDARILIETASAGMAAERVTDENLQKLEEIYGEMDDVLKRGDNVRYSSLDYDFHHQIAFMGGNKILLKMLERIRVILYLQLLTSNRDNQTERTSHKMHRNIINAIASKDSVKTKEAMGEHLRIVAETYKKGLPLEIRELL
jgi:GntR family transcriptional repressor for pyruvate dehydrogenase complex